MNGLCERYNQTFSNAVRANLHLCDKRLWDWCAKFCAHVYNRTENRSGKKSPYERRHDRKPDNWYFKRFGCLVSAKVHTHVGPLENKREMGVFLGYGKSNTSYLVGSWRPDERYTKSDRLRWEVSENKSVTFYEHIIIPDIETLKPDRSGVYTPYTAIQKLCDATEKLEMGVTQEGSS